MNTYTKSEGYKIDRGILLDQRGKQIMCSPTSKKLCGSSICAVCFPRSFASHPRAAEWSDEYDWKGVLKREVERLKERKGEKARCVFISRREMYGDHIRGVEDSVIVERVEP